MAHTIFTRCLDTLNLTDTTGHYVYIAWADDELGNGYTTTFSLDKRYFAIRVSTSELTESASLYTGRWQPVGYPNKTTLCDYNFVRTLDTSFKGHQQLPFNYQTLGMQAWYYEGTYRRVYFTFHGRCNWNPTIVYSTNYISYYDVDTGEFAAPVDLGVDIATLTDPHVMAFPFVDSSGYVHVLHEKGKTGTTWDANSQHNTEMVHKKANATESISSFTTIGDITSSGRSYPHIWELSNGNFHCTWRAGSYDSVYTAYSDDDGDTFKDMSGTANSDTEVLRLGDATDGYAYHMQLAGPKSQGINILVLDYDAGDSHSIDNIYFLHSEDGITWENIQSWKSTGSDEFSKNVVSSGYITNSELDTNCKVPATSPDPSNKKWNFRAGVITKTGMPVVVYVYEDYSGDNRIDNVYLAYWSGSSWTQKEITTDIWGHESLCRPEGSIAKVHAIVPYSDTCWDFVVSYIPDGLGLPLDDANVKDAGEMVGEMESTQTSVFTGCRYLVVDNDYSAGIPWNSTTHTAGYIYSHLGHSGTGSSYGDGNGTLNATNRVKPVRLATKVMRTFDSGTNWHEVASIRSDEPFGLSRAATHNAHFLDDEKLFVFIGDHTSSGQTFPDATNVKMIYEDLKVRDI